jgi:alkylresorcinol/alkylpyrone synthase
MVGSAAGISIPAVGKAFPENYYDQETLIAAFKTHWSNRHFNLNRLEDLHRHVLVGGRHLALPLEAYEKLESFTESNRTYIELSKDIGERAIRDGLESAGLEPADIDHLFFVTTTGIATPSIDASLVNRLRLRPDVKRTPIFGLGCLGGTAGIARAADYLRAYTDHVAVVLSIELCSLTLQREDLSIPNIIASGLFGDGAAAAVLAGADKRLDGPRVLAHRSFFYTDTEYVMGWDITSDGFGVVLSADVPKVVHENIGSNVGRFLADCGLEKEQIESYVCHPGGPKVLKAFQDALGLPREALALTWNSLQREGNLSSASVLMVLRDTMQTAPPPKGSYGLMLAMGPGFCSEIVLLQW